MHSTKLLAAVAAFTGYAVAQSTCTKDIEISEPTPAFDCDVIDAKVEVKESVAGNLMLNGPKTIKGDLVINNATNLISIQSNTLSSIEGRFALLGLNSLNSIQMDSLRTINNLEMEKLPALRDLTFGTEGVTKASEVQVTDTFLSSLSGLKLATVERLQIDNNDRLTKFDSDLVNITDTLIINNNGRDMEISMLKLKSASEIQIANVKAFSVPLLSKVGASLKFDECDELQSFLAPNLTKVTDALAFINNKKLTNITFPKLTEIGGDLRIVNNTKLATIDGFPEFEACASINFGGNFKEIELPKLERVGGTAKISTTTTDQEVCDVFNDADDDGKIRGGAECTYNNENANKGGDSDGGDTSSGSSSDSDDDDDAAGIVGVNSALLGLAAVVAIAQLL